MNYQEKEISEYIEKSIQTKNELLETEVSTIARISQLIIDAYKHGHKVIWFGNGGSAADAQHLACELVSRFFLERKALPSIALNTNTSVLTAVANDYDFDKVYSRQIEALADRGDVVIGISTSGNSKNVIEAIKKAKELGAITIALTGASGGRLKGIADNLISVPSEATPHIQESHIMIGHIICYLVEKELFGDKNEK